MVKAIGYLLGGVLTSLYLFSFEFFALPGVNTKMMLAVVSLLILFFDISKNKKVGISKDFIYISLLASLVSIVGLFSITYNNTSDYTYAGYLLSAWTWLGGAYTVYRYIKLVHGNVTWQTLTYYLAAVCVFQCVMALWMDLNHNLRDFVDIYINQNQDFLKDVERLYGIGASVDVAGTKFALVQVIIFYSLINERHTPRENLLLTLSLIVIVIIGNMIARTTIVGLGLGFIYLLLKSISFKSNREEHAFTTWMWIGGFVLISVPVAVYFYNTDEVFYEHVRFAFEGFFSLVEKGRWEISSNETLKSMVVYPESLKTWIIGDGYFSSPRTDPYFIGKIVGGYYMGTDIGYLRFLFYFGAIGLLSFIIYLTTVTYLCIRKNPQWKGLFVLLLIVNFIVWGKVSTDVFMILALFFCIDSSKESMEKKLKLE